MTPLIIKTSLVVRVKGAGGGDDYDDEKQINEEPVVIGGYNLRGNREQNYHHCFAFLQHVVRTTNKGQNIDDDTLQQCFDKVVNICMMQMTAKKGIETYRKLAVDAIFKEFAQLDDLQVYGPLDTKKLIRSQKRLALRAITLVKEKCCGKIKGSTVADGRPQQKIFSKDETTLPTVLLEVLLMSLMVDTKEERDVGTADGGGAFLHRDMDDFVILKMVGNAVNIMCRVNAKYKEFVTIENRKCVLYLQLLKALYSCVKTALIWYTLFATTLKEMGFKINRYDKCVANKMIKSAQCTIVWYVDNNKISHIDPKVVKEILNRIEKRFGNLTITRGKQHTFLGMDINFIRSGKVKILMKEYIVECIEAYELKEDKMAATPAKNDLFDINEDSLRLSDTKAKLLHSIVAKLLYIGNQAQPDVILPVTFLCTRVQPPTEQDRTKL